jgi:3-carboxy-cis,cis-muconate cycloisomerase
MVRQLVAALLDAMVAEHERSAGPWEIEWIAVPDMFLLTAGALQQARTLLAGLEVDTSRMRANLELTQGQISTEAVMMGLAPQFGRQRTHDLVSAISRQASVSGRPLLDLLAENEEITAALNRDALARLLDPTAYLGLSGEMVDRVLERRAPTGAPDQGSVRR